MRKNKTLEHPDDAKLLAFLDGELCMSEARTVKMHMKRCWKCRTALADLESQVEYVSRLLAAGSDADIDRTIQAKTRFLDWKKAFEKKKANFLLWFFGLVASLLTASRWAHNFGKSSGHIGSHFGRKLAMSQNLLAAFEV